MIQVKIIKNLTYDSSDFENLVNTYLKENEATIEVIDIKYNVCPSIPPYNAWKDYFAMIIYKPKNA